MPDEIKHHKLSTRNQIDFTRGLGECFCVSFNLESIVAEFEKPGPRYTSYPTAPFWKSKISSDSFLDLLSHQIQKDTPLSLYFHLPFCEKFCHFCACHKTIDPNREHSEKYLAALKSEIQIWSKNLAGRGSVVQMHWGGGTPTFYSPQDLDRLFQWIRNYFQFSSDAELSLEVNPVVTTKAHLKTLSQLGFNRLSLGVQDFDLRVQDVINRHQSFEQTRALVKEARHLGFLNVNLDLVYGLPLQSLSTIQNTVEKVIEIRPERIAFYSYANVPWKQPFQRRFKDEDLPVGHEKISLYLLARKLLEAAGYQAIGMDHFALPSDELFKAQQQKVLHRNFMGYTTRGDAELIGMGVSAISMLDRLYVQNKKTLPSYYLDLENGELPIERGFELSSEDTLRRKIIMDLMCNFEIAIDGDFKLRFEKEWKQLKELEAKGLLQILSDKIEVVGNGRYLVRNIAMIFDSYLETRSEGPLFSQTI